MFKRIKIQNFQSHKNTIIKLHSGLNAIIGLPGRGKTPIIRSIILLWKNRPSGGSYHSNFAKSNQTKIKISPDNSKPLILTKTCDKKVNTKYQIGIDKYDKVGTNQPPDKIQNAINLDEINFHNQFDSPYLVNLSPPEIARTINKFAGIDELDLATKYLKEKVRLYSKGKDYIKLEIKSLKNKIKLLSDIDKAKVFLDKSRKYNKKIKLISNDIEDLKEIKEFINNSKTLLKSQSKLSKAGAYIKRAKKIRKEIDDTNSKITIIKAIFILKTTYKLAIRERKKLIREYILALKEEKKCPTCYNDINSKSIKIITKELNK